MPLTVVIRRRPPRHPRRRRWPIYAVVILLAVGFSMPFWVAGLFREDLIEAVTYRIDRPADIRKLTIRLTPKPALVAYDVRIGHPEFNVRADRVTIEINLASLSRRVVDITSVQVDGLVCTIPEKPGDLAREIKALEFRPGRGKGKWSGVIARAHAEDVRVVFAGQEESVLAGSVDVRDLLTDEIRVAVDAAAPVAGDAAVLNGTLSFVKRPSGEPVLAIEGSATLTNVDSRAFVEEDIVPNTRLDFASIAFERTGSNSVTIQMHGNSYPASAEADQVRALTGAFNATAVWQDGETNVHVSEWRADGFEFNGDIAIDEEGAIATSIAEGVANAAGIEAYFKLRPLAEYTVKPRKDAKLSVANLRIYRAPDGLLSLKGGAVAFSGVDLLVDDGDQAFSDFSGDLSIADDVVTLTKVAGDGLTIMGTVTTDFAEQSYYFDLNGEAELSRQRLSGFVATDRIKEAAGRIQIVNLKGTATPGGGIPDDLIIEGKLIDGRFQIESPEWSDTLENVTLTFDAETDRIGTSVIAQSAMFGSVTADGTFFTAEDRWAGNVSGDFSSVVLPSLEGRTRDVVTAIFEELGRSELKVEVAATEENDHRIRVDATRLGGNPALAATVGFSHNEDAWALEDVVVTANLSSRILAALTPDSVATAGPMDVQFNRSAANQRFRANVNLDAVEVSLGDHLTKRAGAPFTISIEGRADNELWAAEIVAATLLDTNIRGALDGDRFTSESFDVDVASLAPLLREGGTASGRITGTIRTNPADVSLNLDNVQLALSEDLVADYINGRLRVSDDGVEADELEVRAANSEFILKLRETNGRWGGGISGSQVDATALMRFFDEYRSMTNPKAATVSLVSLDAAETGQSLLADAPKETAKFAVPIQNDPESDASAGIEGEFDVKIDNLIYRNATLSNVRTRLVASGGNFSANNLTFVPYKGSASGNIRYSRGEPPYGNHIIADLVFEGADARIVDDLVFETPRNLKGTLSGDVMLDLPIGPDGVELGGVNGRLNVQGADGTLGSLGFANAILFVFKTTEILFLRSPFAEGGLSFTELTGKATIANGLVTLGVFENDAYTEAITLERPSYRMSAIGWIDLGKWDSEVVVHMQPLSSVADAARIFKIDEVDAINNRGGIRIYMSGAPDDPKTKIGFGGPVNAITNEIRSGVQSVQDLVKDQIVEGLGGLLRGLLER